MSILEEKAAEALDHVLKAERLMEDIGDTKYQLSGMISAEMRYDLEKETSKLLGELAETRKQRDALAEALSMYSLPYSDDEIEHIAQNPSPYTEIGAHEANRELIRRKALAAVKGGGA